MYFNNVIVTLYFINKNINNHNVIKCGTKEMCDTKSLAIWITTKVK